MLINKSALFTTKNAKNAKHERFYRKIFVPMASPLTLAGFMLPYFTEYYYAPVILVIIGILIFMFLMALNPKKAGTNNVAIVDKMHKYVQAHKIQIWQQ